MDKQIAVIMGSTSDWDTMKEAVSILENEFGVKVHRQVISAHRMPDELTTFAKQAKDNHIQAIIAGAGGAAHLPGMLAANTIIPVIGVPVQSKALNGLDSLLSIVQMPAGIPVATVAIGSSGAKNAALLAVQILALNDEKLNQQLESYRQKQTEKSVQSNEAIQGQIK